LRFIEKRDSADLADRKAGASAPVRHKPAGRSISRREAGQRDRTDEPSTESSGHAWRGDSFLFSVFLFSCHRGWPSLCPPHASWGSRRLRPRRTSAGPISSPPSGDSYEQLLLVETLKGLTCDRSGGRFWEVHGACLRN